MVKESLPQPEDMGIIKADGNFLDMRSRKGWHKLNKKYWVRGD